MQGHLQQLVVQDVISAAEAIGLARVIAVVARSCQQLLLAQ
jgi:hypothetical protein